MLMYFVIFAGSTSIAENVEESTHQQQQQHE